jgi:hypothetical protein
MEQMYPTHVLEFLALSIHYFDPTQTFEPLPSEFDRPDSDAVTMVEQLRPRGMWKLVQTEQGLRRTLMPHPKDMFRNALRQRLPDTPRG